MNKKKIGIVLGTRPEAIKLIPVYLAFKVDPEFDTCLISTGQHREMLQQIFSFFSIQEDYDLAVMQPNQTLSSLSASVITGLDKLLIEHPLDAIIVQGDTTTCAMASLVAFYHKCIIIHVEAGLRTYQKYSPFPEEMNRKITGVLADFHFAPTERSAEALAKEGIFKNVHVVGNTVIDSLTIAKQIVLEQKDKYESRFAGFKKEGQKLVLITGHRRESFGDGFKNICDAIVELAEAYPEFNFVYPVHLNPNVREVVFERLAGHKNIFLIDPLPYDELVYLMYHSFIILTDSGGIQEEAPTFGIPVLVLRDTTERPEGVDAGCSILCGTDKNKIVQNFHTLVKDTEAYKKISKINNPYGKGDTADQIVKVIKKDWSYVA